MGQRFSLPERLAAGESIENPVYDFVTHTRSHTTVDVPPARVVVDGILLFTDQHPRHL
jgi:uridine kinase